MHGSEKNAQVGVERTRRKRRKPLDHLTRDVLAAEKAGMSYGKYKALHPHTPDEDDEQEELEERQERQERRSVSVIAGPGKKVRTCVQCGQPFAAGAYHTNKRYCSDACREKHDNEARRARRKRNKPGRPAVCPICGADFVADCHSRIYCSTECYTEGQRRRTRARWERHKEMLKKETEKNGSN